MARNKTLTQDEFNELMAARVSAIEQVLSELVPGFNTDMENIAIKEIDDTMTTAQKKNIEDEIKANKAKYKAK